MSGPSSEGLAAVHSRIEAQLRRMNLKLDDFALSLDEVVPAWFPGQRKTLCWTTKDGKWAMYLDDRAGGIEVRIEDNTELF